MLDLSYDSRFIGAFTGFAVGDAFGFPCRELTFEQICARFEKKGCLRLAVSDKTDYALFTDATQTMLFTADGIVWASKTNSPGGVNYASYVFYAYQLWLYTQTKTVAGAEYTWLFDKQANPRKSKLLKAKGLYKKRFVGSECPTLSALLEARNMSYGKVGAPLNNNSDNGGIKRVLPAGLFFNYDPQTAFRAGADFAAITHGNPTAYFAAGCYAALIAFLINGAKIDDAINNTIDILKNCGKANAECFKTLETVKDLLADEKTSPQKAVKELGTGEKAVEALGISLYCAALFEDNFENAIRLAVNHDGASDVCGAMCGGLLGAYHGAEFVPKKWVEKLSQLRLIEDTAISVVETTYFNDPDKDEE